MIKSYLTPLFLTWYYPVLWIKIEVEVYIDHAILQELNLTCSPKLFSAFHNGYCAEVKNSFYFVQISNSYLINRCTKYRLVCTHLNVFFMLHPNMAMKIWVLKFFKKCWKKFCLLLVLGICIVSLFLHNYFSGYSL